MVRCQAGSEETYGKALRERRLAAGLTQQDLAEASGASVAAIRDLEQGRTCRPRPALAARLARALGLDPYQAADLLRAGRDPAPNWPTADSIPHTGLRLRVLGPVAAWRDGIALNLGGPRQRALLGLLAVHQRSGMHRDALVDALWGEYPPSTAVDLVHAYVSRLRRILDPDQSPHGREVVTWAYARYTLRATAGQLDLLAFAELVDRAKSARAAGDQMTACGLFEQALNLWQAEPVADITALRQHPAITGLGRTKATVIVSYAEAAFSAGCPGRVLSHLHELACRDPLDESAQAKLMIALAATGQQAAALRVYAATAARLDDQLGVRPGQELAEAHLRVLRQDLPGLATSRIAPDRASVTPACCQHGENRAPALLAGPLPQQLPAGTASFVGRTAELSQLSRLLAKAMLDRSTPTIVTISGPAGIGKTALAVHWARQVACHFPDGQLYVDLRGFDPSAPLLAPGNVIGRFLRALGVTVTKIRADPAARADLYRSVLVGRRVLILLDNARDTAHVRTLLPGSPGCLVVVTSRSVLAGLMTAEGASLLALGALTDAEAAELLASRLGSERTARQPAETNELIGLCERLPLALSLAATVAATRPGVPLTALVAELRDPGSRLDMLNVGDSATNLRDALSSSYQTVSDPARRMLRLLGLQPDPDISVRAAASLADVPLTLARTALRELAGGSMLTEPAPDLFACSDLLRCYAAGQARLREGETGRRAALLRLLGHYAQAGDSERAERVRRALATALAVPDRTRA